MNHCRLEITGSNPVTSTMVEDVLALYHMGYSQETIARKEE